jgi:hypothetical protein
MLDNETKTPEYFRTIPIYSYRDTYGGKNIRLESKSGQYFLSIVMGEHYYSTPRENIDLENYFAIELAIFTKDDLWATKKELRDKGVFDIIGMGEHEYQEDENENAANLFGYVPVELIFKVYAAL